jgi:hypothetical protein
MHCTEPTRGTTPPSNPAQATKRKTAIIVAGYTERPLHPQVHGESCTGGGSGELTLIL